MVSATMVKAGMAEAPVVAGGSWGLGGVDEVESMWFILNLSLG